MQKRANRAVPLFWREFERLCPPGLIDESIRLGYPAASRALRLDPELVNVDGNTWATPESLAIYKSLLVGPP